MLKISHNNESSYPVLFINIRATAYFNGLNFSCLYSLFHMTAGNSSVHMNVAIQYVLVLWMDTFVYLLMLYCTQLLILIKEDFLIRCNALNRLYVFLEHTSQNNTRAKVPDFIRLFLKRDLWLWLLLNNLCFHLGEFVVIFPIHNYLNLRNTDGSTFCAVVYIQYLLCFIQIILATLYTGWHFIYVMSLISLQLNAAMQYSSYMLYMLVMYSFGN